MPPRIWMKYFFTNLAMKIRRDAAPTNLQLKIMANSYKERQMSPLSFVPLIDPTTNKGQKGSTTGSIFCFHKLTFHGSTYT